MITERAFKTVIVDTEQRFDACIATLVGLKAGKASPDLITFQGTLATALLKCAELDTRLAEEERRVIERKGALASHWFSRRLKTLAARRAHIRSVSGIGRAIGDSFAWFFYRSDRSLLLEHAQHDRPILSPTGVGGRAEVEFIKGVPLIGAHFVLYHGITSLLRIGDFSLVRLQPLGVVALGELKAGAKHDQTVPVQAHIFYKKGEVEGLPLDLDRPQGNPERSVVASLTPKAQARFARQSKRMATAVRSASEQVQKELLESRQSSYLPDLRRVIQANPARRFHFSRLGGGLVVAMFRSPRRSLYGYLRGDAAALRRVISVDLSRCVATTVDRSSPYNAIIVSGILFNDDGQPDLILGTVPPFWWGLPAAFTRDLLLQRVNLVSIFNPAHLIRRVQEAGYRVERFAPPADVVFGGSAQTVRGPAEIEIVNSTYFFQLVARALLREEQVCDLIVTTTQRSGRQVTHNTRINLHFSLDVESWDG